MTISGLVVGTYLAVLLGAGDVRLPPLSSLVWLYYRNRHRRPRPPGTFAELPAVTVQLPLFNEMYVVERLLDAVAGIRYPRDRFQIQVLDDSTDETQEICKRKIAELRARASPSWTSSTSTASTAAGFKAGALRERPAHRQGRVHPDLRRRLPAAARHPRARDHHFSDPKVAVVQCRWEHVNRDFSALTEVQALMLDGHFIMEHAGRNWSGRFFNFNGTAGMWRRAAIADAGGWQHDTLTEDMDLSYRAQLRGWKFVYLPEIVGAGRAAGRDVGLQVAAVPLGQGLGAGGAASCCRRSCVRTPRFAQKSEAFFHLTNNLAYPLLAGAVDPAAAEPGAAHPPRLARGADHRPAAVLRDDAVGGVVLPGLAARDRAACASPARAASVPVAARQAPAAGDVDRHRPVRQPDARRVRGAAGPRDRVRAHAEARHPRQARVAGRARSTAPPSRSRRSSSWAWPPTSSSRSASPSITATTCRCPFLALFLCGFGYVGWVSVWQGGFGAAVRGALARRRGVTVVRAARLPGHGRTLSDLYRRDHGRRARPWFRAAPAPTLNVRGEPWAGPNLPAMDSAGQSPARVARATALF